MTVFTFDDLAVHAYASGSVDAWMRLIDEAIDLGRVADVRKLWISEWRLSSFGILDVSSKLFDTREPGVVTPGWTKHIEYLAEQVAS